MAAPSYVGSASNPSDNGSANEPTTLAVTPPASMQAGDLVFLFGQHDSGLANISLNNQGGQTWNGGLTASGSVDVWWCQFNGTWSANPSLDFASVGGTHATTAVMHVFRPSSANVTWQETTGGGFSSYTTTINVTGGTPGLNDSVTLFILYLTGAAGTFSSIGGGSGGTFASAGNAQYRNTAGGDQTMGFAYMTKGTASSNGSLTGTASNAGNYIRYVLAAVPNGTLFTETYTETVTLVDSLIRQPGKVLTDVATIVDTVIKLPSRILTDMVTIVDTNTLSRLLSQLYEETTTILDTVIRGPTKLLSEAITIVDTYTDKITAKILTETIALVDTILNQVSRTFSEVITLVDTLATQITAKVFSEAVTIVDTIERQTSRLFTEVLTIVDTVLNHAGKLLSEVVTLEDITTLTKVTIKTLEEVVTIVDTILNQGGKVLSETLTFVDEVVRVPAKVYTETVALVDIVLRTPGRVLLETIILVDVIVNQLVLARVFTEIITISESILNEITSVARRIRRMLMRIGI